MPALAVYTNPIKPGICQMPVYSLGDPQNWTLTFNNGNGLYDPTGVSSNLGYVNGLDNIAYPNAFQWVDRLNNRHTASFAVAAGVPGSLTWDDQPLVVGGGNGAWILRGRIAPSSQIRKIYLDAPGIGYSAVPTVGFDTAGGPGSGAAATATVEARDGGIQSITVTGAGSNYASAPNVVITPVSGGSGAAATAIVANGFLVLIQVTNPGVGYYNGATISFTGGSGGSGASATAQLFSNMVTQAVITNPGSGYTSPPTITSSGGNGSGAQFACTINSGSVAAIAVGNPGSGYNSGAQYNLVFTGGGGNGAAGYVTCDNYNASPPGLAGTFSGNKVTLISGGSGYTSAPTVTIAPVGGINGAATAVEVSGAVTFITIGNTGSGYTNPPLITFSGGGPSQVAQAHAVIGGGVIQQIVIDFGGTGYTSNPSVIITNSLGSNATMCAQLNYTGYGVVQSAAVDAAGAFSTYPTVTIVGGGGTGCTAVARCTTNGSTFALAAILITNSGSGYMTAPSVVLSSLGTVTTYPLAHTIISNDGVSGVYILQGGSGYPPETQIPLVFSGNFIAAPVGYVQTDSTGRVALAQITSVGSYVSSIPTVTISSTGSGCILAAIMNDSPPFGSINAINILNGGSGYTGSPTLAFSGGGGSNAAGSAVVNLNVLTQVLINPGYNGSGYTALPGVTFSPNNSTQAECSGVPFGFQPWIRQPITFEVQSSCLASPFYSGRQDTSGNQQFDDSILLIRPKIILTPTWTLQPDGVTYTSTFNPVTPFVAAVLRYRRSVTVDIQIFGAGGRLLYLGALTILNSLLVTP